MFSVKELVVSGRLTSVPSNYIFKNAESDDDHPMVTKVPESIPTIDFYLLTSPDPYQRCPKSLLNSVMHAWNGDSSC